MESNCNNQKSMSCARGHMQGCSGHVQGYSDHMSGCSQVMQNRERMVQQQNRECMVQQQRCDDCMEDNKRGECQQCRKEAHVQQARRCNVETVQQCNRGMRSESCGSDSRAKSRGRVERVANSSEMQNRNCNGNVSVECVCQVTCKKDCHRHDEMEQLGCEFPVVMAYVPWQQWGDLYEAECGLKQGTVFKDLNFIFCGERC